MAMITVEVWDATGSKKTAVELPDDAPVNRILVVLVEKMHLPRQSPDGQLMSYKFHHKATGRQLLDTQSLAEGGVKAGDVLRLQPEITAGALQVTLDDRFSRFGLIEWWDQRRLTEARVVVVGAGALGNELVKNCALLGVGRLVIIDLDRIELSNLSRAVLFRPEDAGAPKAEVAAPAATGLFPSMRARALACDVVHAVGLGLFRWADVVLGGVDNREARLSVNRACYQVGTPWIDGAIEALSGIARVFVPPEGPCYECTMSAQDFRLLEQRRSCTLLNRELAEHGKVPTTPTTASVVAGIQCQEALKLLHGRAGLSGEGFVFDGVGHSSFRTAYPRNPDCLSHEPLDSVREMPVRAREVRLRDALGWAREALGEGARLEFARELLLSLDCPACGASERVLKSLTAVTEREAPCPRCQERRAPQLFHAVAGNEDFLDLTLSQVGVPDWDIVKGRKGDRVVGFELAGDRADALGACAEAAGEGGGLS